MSTDPITQAAERLGAEAGKAAASWYFDGNTTQETYRAVLRGIEDGDPRVLDTFPPCDLSGQWADEPSGPQVHRAILTAAGIDYLDNDEDDEAWQERNDLLDAYEMAYDSAVQDEIERMAREQVTP